MFLILREFPKTPLILSVVSFIYILRFIFLYAKPHISCHFLSISNEPFHFIFCFRQNGQIVSIYANNTWLSIPYLKFSLFTLLFLIILSQTTLNIVAIVATLFQNSDYEKPIDVLAPNFTLIFWFIKAILINLIILRGTLIFWNVS